MRMFRLLPGLLLAALVLQGCHTDDPATPGAKVDASKAPPVEGEKGLKASGGAVPTPGPLANENRAGTKMGN